MKYISSLLIFLFCFKGYLCAEYELKVTTGSSLGAGTDANVYIKIIGTKGVTAEHKLVGSGDPFKRGRTDHFLLPKNVTDVGEFTAIALKRDEDGWFSDWKLFRVLVKRTNSRMWSVFKYDDWTKANEWFTIQVTCEPGFQKNQHGACFGPICGSRPTSRILSGSVAPKGAWPWQAMLRFTIFSNRPHLQMFCGGALILPQWVLTTANCAKGRQRYMFVRLGAYYKDKTVGTEQDITVEKILIHPKLNSPTLLDHDLALVKLSRPATLSHGTGLVCLPDQKLPLNNGESCWITGWGYTDTWATSKPDKLKQGQIPLVPRAKCAADHPTSTIDESVLCGGSRVTGVSGCDDDTGGPLVREVHGKWYLEGIFNRGGFWCNSAGYAYQIYSNVTYYKEWIYKTIADNQ